MIISHLDRTRGWSECGIHATKSTVHGPTGVISTPVSVKSGPDFTSFPKGGNRLPVNEPHSLCSPLSRTPHPGELWPSSANGYYCDGWKRWYETPLKPTPWPAGERHCPGNRWYILGRMPSSDQPAFYPTIADSWLAASQPKMRPSPSCAMGQEGERGHSRSEFLGREMV